MSEESKTQNQAWLFNSYPDPVISVDNLKLVDVDMPGEPSEGKVILKSMFISVDPYMRGRMKKSGSGYAKGTYVYKNSDLYLACVRCFA